MKTKKLLASSGCFMRHVLTAISLVFVVNTAHATHEYTPTTTWNVTPVDAPFPDARVCPNNTTLWKDLFQEAGPGNYSAITTVTGIYGPVDITVNITVYADNSFDFVLDGGVTRQMWVKGSDFKLYQYDPKPANGTNSNVGPVYSDTGLHDGVNDTDTEGFQGISHIDFCVEPAYPLRGDKTASGSYDRTVTWDLDKTVNPASHSGNAGEAAGSSTWTVVVDKTETLDNYQVAGNIDVHNDNAFAVPVAVSDSLSDGTVAAVSCPSATVEAGATMTCSYVASPDNNAPGINTATIDSDFAVVDGTIAIAPYIFQENLIGTDSGLLLDPRFGYVNAVSSDSTVTFDETFQCSADANDYTNGSYSYTETNTANLAVDVSLDASADVTVDCTLAALEPTKTVVLADYDEQHDWGLEKTVVGPGAGPFYAGDTPTWTWTIDVTETVVDQNFAVTGTITINNPAAIDQTFSVSDIMDDGTVPVVTCPTNTVAAGGSVSCSYDASPADASATLNTATVSAVGNADQTATAGVSFAVNVLNDTATLSDSEIGLIDVVVDGPAQFAETDGDVCSSDLADYSGGTYSGAVTNVANLTDADGTITDDASTGYTCEASSVGIYKTTNGAPADPGTDIAFGLFSYETQPPEADPKLRTPTLADTVSTAGVGADLNFSTALVPGEIYSICEAPVPAGFTFEISVAGFEGVVLTYAGPPGDPAPTGEIQCFDFVAGQTGTSLSFDIENSAPGGGPRTPGYWKNWNTCSGGNQQSTAEKLGGVSAGVFLMDDLLPQALGSSLTVDNCEDGVAILSATDLVEVDKKGDLVNRGSDGAYTLARALMAARLNQDAGACPADGLEAVLTAADSILSSVEFNGTGSYLSPQDTKGKNNPLAAVAQEALALYEIIDDYNNGLLCSGTPSH